MDKEAKKIYTLWKTQFVKVTKFTDELTKDQISDFISRKEIQEISKFNDNQIKLAMYSAYLNKTAKLYNILEILRTNNPEILNDKKSHLNIDSFKTQQKRIYETPKNKSRKKKNTVKKLNKKQISAEKKWIEERNKRKEALKRIEIEKNKQTIKDKEISSKLNQINLEKHQTMVNKELEENFINFGQRLTNEEIKNMLDKKPKNWKESLDHRFESGPQDKSSW